MDGTVTLVEHPGVDTHHRVGPEAEISLSNGFIKQRSENLRETQRIPHHTETLGQKTPQHQITSLKPRAGSDPSRSCYVLGWTWSGPRGGRYVKPPMPRLYLQPHQYSVNTVKCQKHFQLDTNMSHRRILSIYFHNGLLMSPS